ncbi:hypothetical protein ACQ86N_14525 [Puia sp. P3]|uniref:hypothetical protein n=1 Tax=Puia sp. P3 TaxID=3423952 RepID=UPI003D671B7C
MESELHEQVHAYATRISELLLPKTRAFYEIWLDEEKLTDKKDEEDPLYQDRYLPRKFKIGLVIPPNNDIDVLTNDLALIAIIEDGKLKGFNLAIGGGLGATHGNAETYPRLASVLCYVPADDEKLFKAIYEVVTIQRDYGNRSDRKLARLKYTVDKYGLDWYRAELEKRVGFPLEDPRPFTFTDRTDHYGWKQNHKGLWYYTPYVECGRVVDDETVAMKTALLEAGADGKGKHQIYRHAESDPVRYQNKRQGGDPKDTREIPDHRTHRGGVGRPEERDRMRRVADLRTGAGGSAALPPYPAGQGRRAAGQI